MDGREHRGLLVAAELAEGVDAVPGGVGVEAAGGLVEEDEVWLGDELDA